VDRTGSALTQQKWDGNCADRTAADLSPRLRAGGGNLAYLISAMPAEERLDGDDFFVHRFELGVERLQALLECIAFHRDPRPFLHQSIPLVRGRESESL
jgi:hypothetical protein